LRRLLGAQIELVFHPSCEPLWVNGDSGMMEQVVVNLCVNARDAMPRGGRLTITARAVERPASPPDGGAPDGPYVCLTVSDTGCGMDAATLKRIFEPFFTTKEVGKGTGLGLATVYGIVKEHRGWIEVDSAPDAGTTFRIHLPREPADVTAAAPAINIVGGNECVLLVEDELSVRELVARSLRRAGYQVLDAPHAAGARAHWTTAQRKIDLLVTDMVMPGGTTGLELAEELRRISPGLRVIITTGHSDHATQLTAAQTGSVRFLPKPFEATLLLNVVRETLDQPVQS
jgi:CheY-like chemotaxis protein